MQEINLNWKWSADCHPTDKTLPELIADLRQQFLENNGRLLTEEEAIQLVDEIRKELREQDEKTRNPDNQK